MANQIPLQEAINSAGGFLVPEELGQPLLQTIAREAAFYDLAAKEQIRSNRLTWPVYLGRPTAGFVGEGVAKPLTGAEFGSLTVNIKKMATQVIYTEELLEDARIDPQVLVNQDVESAFADLIDANMAGTHPGGASTQATFSTNFDAALANTTQSIELGTGSDALAVAVSTAIETLEGNGIRPNGIAAALDAKGHLRNQRDLNGLPLYTDGFTREPDSIYGLPLRYTTNLDGFPAGVLGGAGSPAKVVAIVGDFNNAKAVAHTQLRVRIATEATVGVHKLFEENKVAAQWEMRMGFQVFDMNRAFVKIVNAT